MSGPAGSRLQGLRRAVERGDPRLVLAVGAAVSVLVALTFVRSGFAPAERLEWLALDLAFRLRPPIRESDRILQVDMDDNTFRKLRWPVPREAYAQAVHALDRLGASQVVFDVQFKAVMPRTGEFDPATGAHLLSPGDRALRLAMARSGRVLLAYHFDFEDPLPGEVLARAGPLRELFARKPGATAAEAAAASGLDLSRIEPQVELIRDRFVVEAVAAALAKEPRLGFPDLRARMLPDFDERLHAADLNVLQYAYWHARSTRLLEEKSVPVQIEGLPRRPRRVHGAIPVFHPFLEAAAGAGCVNAAVDPDGVLRRPWAGFVRDGRAFGYLGLEAAARQGGAPARVVLYGDRVEVGDTALPIDAEGRLQVNFAGNAARSRRGPAGAPYGHVPFTLLLSAYQARYETLDGNARRTILQISEDQRSPEHAEYLRLSDRLREGIEGRSEMEPAELRAAEARLDAIRSRLAADLASDLAEIDRQLPALAGKQRLRETLEKARAARAAQLEALRAAEALERQLRPKVEGRLCIIGSASTASGDLHPTPIDPATPGMDVPANVANMILTDQSFRRAPAAAGLLYLSAVGALMAWVVAHAGTTASAAALAGISAGTALLFGALFAGPMILVPGAGPVITALSSFAASTAFKELVTQRSKRKLQRELEKNTSKELVGILLEHPEFLSVPRKMTGTFFFSDIKAFTSISETMTPEVLVPFINRYLDRMTRALKAHQAYLDKYIGDGIMALFGVPVASAEHARNACLAALDCRTALAALNVELERDGYPRLSSRIGIHSGDCIAGYVGAADRSDYTVLGDAVNLASRLEGANKEYGSTAMISETTRALVGDLFVVRELDRIRVVGKRVAVRIYELVCRSGELPPFDPHFLPEYEGAMAAFRDRRWNEAREGFERALALKPGDRPCEIFISRAGALAMNPPPADWEGVFDLTSK